MKAASPTARAGNRLREIRESLGLTLREVYELSERIADARQSPVFIVPISRLSDIEAKGKLPSLYRLYSLSRAYQTSLKGLLSLYGVD